MRSWLGHFAGFGALAFLASQGAPAGHAQQDDLIERGKAVVVGAPGIAPAQACVNCHGVDGKGDFAAGFPRLAGQSSDYLFQALQAYAAGTRNNQIMSPIAKSLSEGQMRNVAAYYASLEETPWLARPGEDPGILQYGAALSSIGSAPLGIQGCINCHGPAGQGLPPSYPYLAGQPAAYLTARLRDYQAMPAGSGTQLQEIMANIARRMGSREIEALSNYFASIAPRPVRARAEASYGPEASQ